MEIENCAPYFEDAEFWDALDMENWWMLPENE